MEMTVTVIGSHQLAEQACRMVFGENAVAGPVRPAPRPLLELLAAWPGRDDAVHDLALELPPDLFDIEKPLEIGKVKSVVLRVCRVTVLHQGRKVGYAIRTDELGLNGIAVWESRWQAYTSRLRQAH